MLHLGYNHRYPATNSVSIYSKYFSLNYTNNKKSTKWKKQEGSRKETEEENIREARKGNELENGEHDTEHSTDERFDNLDNIVLGITDGTEGERFYFVGVLYDSKLDFIGCFNIIFIVGLDNKLLIFYWRSKH